MDKIDLQIGPQQHK